MASITNNRNKSIWIIGHGYIGHKVANLYQKQSVRTRVTSRSQTSLNKDPESEQRSIQLDLDLSENISDFATEMKDAHVFYFVPPPRFGLKDTRLRTFLDRVGDQPKRIVLISTTGVYGDCKGQWVDETQALKPRVERAWRRVDAESQLIKWKKKHSRSRDPHEIIILRVPGIYAEDRLPIARLKKELPIVREEESPWTNRIHADDLATICYRAMESEYSDEVFNVSDGSPSTMTAYFNQVADYMGLPRPKQISLQQAENELSTGMMSYMKESRRISHLKMMKLLNITLRYPSLADCLKKKHKTP